MDFGLTGKVALVTGAAQDGLGRAHALSLAKEGATVILLDILPCDESKAAILEATDGRAVIHTLVGDLGKPEMLSDTLNACTAQVGTVDILINNAGILSTIGMFDQLSPEKWARDVEINLLGTAHITRMVWPAMLAKKWGRVIMISSFAGTHGGAGQSSYAATKAALIGLAKSLALEGARANVTVNVVAPGVIGSNTVTHMIRPDMMERMEKKAAMRRVGTPAEIGDVVAFLASQQASYITGQVVEVDGGAGLFTF